MDAMTNHDFSVRRAAAWAGGSVAALMAAIYLGSRGFKDLDPSNLGYLAGTLVFVWGSTYRLAVFLIKPATRMFLRGALTRKRSAGATPGAGSKAPRGRSRWGPGARAVGANLLGQAFIWRRQPSRWLGHMAISWGCLLSGLVTFPLVFGWVHFRLVDGSSYDIMVFGQATHRFVIRSLEGWMLFHALDFTAAMLVLGLGLYYWRRLTQPQNQPEQRSEWDLLPLHLLLGVAVSGLMLTVDSAWLDGAGYSYITVLHQALVVVTLAYLPWSKLFHLLFRPLAAAVQTYHEQGRLSPQICPGCGRAYAPAVQIGDLTRVLGDLDVRQPYLDRSQAASLLDLCPDCKRVQQARLFVGSAVSQEVR